MTTSDIVIPIELSTAGLCFVSGTLVLLDSGLTAIDSVHVGDIVLSYNEQLGKTEPQHIVRVFKRETKSLVRIKINNEIIWSTPEHRFYSNHKWVEAKQLVAGDKLTSSTALEFPVLEIIYVDTIQYRFSILKLPKIIIFT